MAHHASAREVNWLGGLMKMGYPSNTSASRRTASFSAIPEGGENRRFEYDYTTEMILLLTAGLTSN